MIVASVLKLGGIYTPEWVDKLAAAVAEHMPAGTRYDFVCLSDDPSVETGRVRWIPLRDDLPGWWSKLELFRPGLFDGRVIYFDLDTLVLGDLSELVAYRGAFAGLRDFIYPARLQTAVLAWYAGVADVVYERFRPTVMQERGMWSDQPWIDQCVPGAERLQDHMAGIYSLRLQAMDRQPDDAVLVCGHGEPRLHARDAGWAHTVWATI